ncbi:SDR family NAD(P)-dependent oxidoreductase [Streptomyces sp. Qhu-G9]|uniref:SDR family NAD(P)-dependent oxidoreductase n=1 Tax=Streptomyces sp. Qhu-G9 TaxID=3452799 RepID=UPI0022ABDC6D|nr:SDR family NAD(P)-dependent oxidoreductase [Streptomyces aurantiacus]WAU83089.1 SDR family NAD(P)-dependent oxidoreductase [Streptomyces aurantiacus]
MPTTMSARGLIVVTGASTGLGAATARELARQDFHVLAGVRRDSDAEAIRAANSEPVILDITQPEHPRQLARRIASDPEGPPLQALGNNAGRPSTFRTHPHTWSATARPPAAHAHARETGGCGRVPRRA